MTTLELTLADFELIRKLVRAESAIVLEQDKHYLIETRLQMLAKIEGFPSVNHLMAEVRAKKPNVHARVVEAMTTNETSFFRDLQPFEALKKLVLPELLGRREKERRLQIWCAACSTGQEPYSIAMLLGDFRPGLHDWKLQIKASDLANPVLERARRGAFSQLEVNRGLPAPMLCKYFQKQGAEWRIKDEVRSMIEFFQMNLVSPWPALPAMDVIFLRNVLIYFDVTTKQQILARVRKVLRPDGFLFLGGAETTMNLDDSFERVPFERSGCYRLRERASELTTRLRQP